MAKPTQANNIKAPQTAVKSKRFILVEVKTIFVFMPPKMRQLYTAIPHTAVEKHSFTLILWSACQQSVA